VLLMLRIKPCPRLPPSMYCARADSEKRGARRRSSFATTRLAVDVGNMCPSLKLSGAHLLAM
jgi:hypothetical protein